MSVLHAIVLSGLQLTEQILLLKSIALHACLGSTLAFTRWFNLLDLGTKFSTFKIYRKLTDLVELVSTRLCVLEEAAYVRISIFVELFRTILVLCKHFDVYRLQSFTALLTCDL